MSLSVWNDRPGIVARRLRRRHSRCVLARDLIVQRRDGWSETVEQLLDLWLNGGEQ